ncbi:MAG: ThuA domain-containing protein [Phycisphaerales bacterium]
MRKAHLLPVTFFAGVLAGMMVSLVSGCSSKPQQQGRAFRVLVVASSDPDHAAMIARAEAFLAKLAADNHFALDFTKDPNRIDETTLAGYQAFVQLQLAPFNMSPAQQQALQKYIEQGHGWVGIHAAGLTGRQFISPETPYWQWFEDLMGGIVYSPHPAFQKGSVVVEDPSHPVTRNLPESFEISDEWYEFDKSPRPNVRVLARADESTYKQNKPMGDHPILWTNEKYARVLYIGIGHAAALCDDGNFAVLMRDAILWAASPAKAKP